MSLYVVVGGQYGSEGKGKIAALIAREHDIDLAIRCGGPNSGHSFVTADGATTLVRHLPTAYINAKTRLLLPAGAVIDLSILKHEIDSLGIPTSRVGVDRNAMIIEASDLTTEASVGLAERLSSTLCGVGSASARRIMRGADVRLASDAAVAEPWLKQLLTDVSDETNACLDANGSVLVEGTQGFGLSLLHSSYYPKTTSKDTSAAAFISEVGVSPLRVTDIIMVLRTFPIRVAGAQAGPLENEITWENLRRESKSPFPIAEFTTVTRKLRRIGRFEWGVVRKAADINRPTKIAVNCIDHLDFANRGIRTVGALTEDARELLSRIECETGAPVAFIGTGPSLEDTITIGASVRKSQDSNHNRLAS